MCGASLELNATSDVEFYLSIRQVQLLTEIVKHNILKSIRLLMPEVSTSVEREVLSQHASEQEADNDFSWLIPFDVLLTAGRINLITYSRERLNVTSTLKDLPISTWTNSLKPSSVSSSTSKRDTKYDIDITSDSGIGSITNEVPPGGPQLMNWSDMSHDSVSTDMWKVEPLFYVRFSQPHSMLVYRGVNEQKLELSCYDINLNGSRPNFSYTGQCVLAHETTFRCVHVL